ncbi:hypothetical protein IQ260_18905 [Leptolyngbya cf. ectocarpi LEGE 11479]|uniref:Uncharacterized protein n=1 Tax=Leptolyngbya cf. ectocarpi LEGE 11479 TaxID=1828722 RepID=A0A929F7F7_LEPEC|nr:hypothetical protein [Leptolyngbya ectocarpi]MBE9068720.1 hypothetical protein [Leptolyngbya cf. ectocarpi LEGE 11479]
MGDQNSAVEQQFRPDELMTELDIKKQAYYDYLKHLGIKAEKDSKGKAYLTQAQAKSVRLLRAHVVAGGKIEDFDIHEALETALTVADSTELSDVSEPPVEVKVDATQAVDMQSLYREASNIYAQHLTADRQLLMTMLNEMSYETMHPEARAKVDKIRETALPKFNPQAMVREFLSQQLQTA